MAGMTRRDLLVRFSQAAVVSGALAVSGGRAPAQARRQMDDSIGLALGSGGASGLSHIVVLEALEELGLRPACISGTSIGALVGGLFAAGCDSKILKEIVAEFVPESFGSWIASVFSRERISLLDLLSVDVNSGGILDEGTFYEFLSEMLGEKEFEDLSAPLAVTATDFWEREQVVFVNGPLIPAIMASTALPGVLPPVRHRDRLLVDGALVNPVPYDIIMGRTGITIAVEVLGTRRRPEDGMPGYLDLLFNTFDIMQANMILSMRRRYEPEIYLQPPLSGIRTLDFHRAQEIYRQAEPVKDELKRKLEAIHSGQKEAPERRDFVTPKQ